MFGTEFISQHLVAFNIMAMMAYFELMCFQGALLLGRGRVTKKMVMSMGCIAITLHLILLYTWIEVVGGQNLSVLNMLSMSAWLMTLLVLLVSYRKPVDNLFVLSAPIAMLTILLLNVLPQQQVVEAGVQSKTVVHILLSLLSVSVLCVALLQALIVAAQEYLLRHKRVTGIVQMMPALESMENLLFQIIWFGFCLLSLDIVFAWYFFSTEMVMGDIWRKLSLVVGAWLVFAGLLLGRHVLGWRGSKVTYGTLLGVGLLYAVYLLLV